MSNEKRKIVIVNGRAVWAKTEVVEKVTYEEIQDEHGLAAVKDLIGTIAYAIDRGLPFVLRSPGTPVRGKAFDKWRMKVFAGKNVNLEAFTQEGVARQAARLLSTVEDPEMTIFKAVDPSYRESEISSLKDLVVEVRKADEEAEKAVRLELLGEAS